MPAAMLTGSAAILRQAACKGFVSKSRRHPRQDLAQAFRFGHVLRAARSQVDSSCRLVFGASGLEDYSLEPHNALGRAVKGSGNPGDRESAQM